MKNGFEYNFINCDLKIKFGGGERVFCSVERPIYLIYLVVQQLQLIIFFFLKLERVHQMGPNSNLGQSTLLGPNPILT